MEFDNRKPYDSNDEKEDLTSEFKSFANDSLGETTNPTTEPYVRSYEKMENKQKHKRWSGVSAIIGGIVGGVTAACLVALLFINQVIPIDAGQQTNAAAEPTKNESPEIVETIATDDAEVSTNIQEVASAVVGVVNLQ